MVNRVSFSVYGIESFKGGVNTARTEISSEARDLKYKASGVYNKCEHIFQKIEGTLNTMHEDKDAAYDAREYNYKTLEKYENLLKELNQRYEELRKSYSQAYDVYRHACSEETRIHNSSVPSSGNPEVDKKNNEARAKALENAHKAVRSADHQCYLIKQEQERVLRNIEITKHNIEVVKDAINKLSDFITQIQAECDRVEQYRNKLRNDIRALHETESRFDSVTYDSEETLETCEAKAEQAIIYGKNICALLDPQNDVPNHNYCEICFTDIKALDRMSSSLFSSCEQYEDSLDTLQERVGIRESTMQDNVIYEGAMYMNDVADACNHQVNLMRRTARQCREASKNLKEYASLTY